MHVHCILFILLGTNYSKPCLSRCFISISISSLCSLWFRLGFCFLHESQFKFSHIEIRKMLLAVDEILLACKAQTAYICFGRHFVFSLIQLFHYYIYLVCSFFLTLTQHIVQSPIVLMDLNYNLFFTGNDVSVNVTTHITKHTPMGLLHSNHKVTPSGGFVKCTINQRGQGHLQSGWLFVFCFF